MSTGGWAAFLGVPGSTLLDQSMITRILDYAQQRIREQVTLPVDPTGLTLLVFEQKMRDWRSSTENALRKLIGQPVSSIPNDLAQLAGAKQPDDLGSLALGTGAGSLVADALAGVGDIVGKGLILIGIGGLMLMGAWMLFRDPPVIVQQLRRAVA